jgi:AraC-like DNA-binding protein
MPPSHSNPGTIGLTQFGPQVQNAGYFQFPRATEFHYMLGSHHLILVESGRIHAGTPGGPVCGHARDLICFRPAREMTYQVTAGTAFYQVAVQFAAPPRHLLTPELPELGPVPVVTATGETFAEFRKLFEAICVDLPQAGSRHHFRVQTTVFRILTLLASVGAASAVPPSPLDAWERIHLRLASVDGGDFSQADLARELGVSEGHFVRIFRQRFGMTPGLCRMHARLAEAVRRLRETDESVKSVAYSLGFDGAKGLTRSMKKYLNLTASQIRCEEEPALAGTASTAPGGLFPSNQHLLPPGDRVELLMSRLGVSEREL